MVSPNIIKSFNELLPRLDKAILFLSIVGVILAAYLWYEYSQPTEIGCSLVQGCQIVRESEFANLLGIQLPVWGFMYYVAIVFYMLSILLRTKFWAWEVPAFLLFNFVGFVFSIYLTYLEIFVIQAICQWCVLSAVIATILFFISIWKFRQQRRNTK